MISCVIQQLFGPLHRDRALRRNEFGEVRGSLDGGGLGVVHAADEADGGGLVGAPEARGQAHLLDPRLIADGLGQAAQRADVGGQPDVHLLNGQPDVARAQPHVGAAGNIDGEPEGHAVENAYYGYAMERVGKVNALWFKKKNINRLRISCWQHLRFSHLSMADMQSWKSSIYLLIPAAFLAVSAPIPP